MKVFEVITEHCEDDSKEITKTVTYVTTERNLISDVVDFYTRHCLEYGEDLIGVREVLTVCRNIEKPEYPLDEYLKMYEDED